MKNNAAYAQNRRIELMIKISLALVIIFFMLLTGVMVIKGIH